MTKDRAGGLIAIGSLMFFVERTRIVELAAQSRLPAVYGAKESAEAGGLMAYGPNLRESYRHAATYVDISKHAGRVNDESILVDEIAA